MATRREHYEMAEATLGLAEATQDPYTRERLVREAGVHALLATATKEVGDK